MTVDAIGTARTGPAPIVSEFALPARASALRRLARDSVALIAGSILALFVLASAVAPLVAPYDPYFTNMSKVIQPPSAMHWFGTDNAGRDILSRVIYGTRNTLLIGLAGVVIGGFLGGLLGILAAFYRRHRWRDHALGRCHAGVPCDPDRARRSGDLRGRYSGGGHSADHRNSARNRSGLTRLCCGRDVSGLHGGGPRHRTIRPRANVALSDAKLHLHDLRLPDPSLRADHSDRVGAWIPRHGRATTDCRARHDGCSGTRLPVHGAPHCGNPEPGDLSSSCWRPIYSGMRCATCSTPDCSNESWEHSAKHPQL